MDALIYVVVAADDLCGTYLERALMDNPQRKPNPIVFETSITDATLESAQARAASLERAGYGPCRVGRVVFEDSPAFSNERST